MRSKLFEKALIRSECHSCEGRNPFITTGYNIIDSRINAPKGA
ncbi:MAG: hypothetical protein P9L92_10645 [Candidatus Electryonea clarkiae]|nr:hypothetical protein [Candidatus Electryonea clarkiae]MDP8288557.1 hypothetical protein [Candidatus Electryonea clarkiae]